MSHLWCPLAQYFSFFYCGPPTILIYLCGPPPFESNLSLRPSPFVDAAAYKKIFHIVHLYIRKHINFIYNMELFLNILFRYNTLFTSTSENIVNTCYYMKYVLWA